jgi:hypothetical protein
METVKIPQPTRKQFLSVKTGEQTTSSIMEQSLPNYFDQLIHLSGSIFKNIT